MKRILATDTNIIMQRSRYAHKDLTRPDGLPSGVVYGSISSISRIIKRFDPDYFVPVFDTGKSEHRKEISGEYKANRSAAGSEIYNQFVAVRSFLEIIGISPYYEEGVEADDLLAKLAKELKKNQHLTIYTQDHDMQQLVDKNVDMFKPAIQRVPDKVTKYDEFVSGVGFEPRLLADVWAITGDPGDNIHGIRGYGWKKASTAILNYGSLEAAILNDPALTPHAEQLLRNKSLIALDGKVAKKKHKLVPYSEMLENVYGIDEVYEFFEAWGFKQFHTQYKNKTLFTP